MRSSTKPTTATKLSQKTAAKFTPADPEEAARTALEGLGTPLAARPKIVFDAPPTLILAATKCSLKEHMGGVGPMARKALIKYLEAEGYLAPVQ